MFSELFQMVHISSCKVVVESMCTPPHSSRNFPLSGYPRISFHSLVSHIAVLTFDFSPYLKGFALCPGSIRPD